MTDAPNARREPGTAELPFRMSIAGSLSASVGARGLAPEALAAALERLVPALKVLDQAIRAGSNPLLSIVRRDDDLAAAGTAMTRLMEGARTVVFFGTGGSSLGGQTLAQIAGWNIPGSADATQLSRPRTRFYDNLDPLTLGRSLRALDLAESRFVVISKSGGTAETLVQAAAAIDAIRSAGLGDALPRLMLGITEPARSGIKNPLRALLAAHGVPMLDHDPDIGGRFSALSNVGMVAAIARGLDARAVRQGAAGVLDRLLATRNPTEFPPALGAALLVTLAETRSVRTLVMMPYADRLGRFSHWWVQLWAESLGKGGKGTTPLAALGPLDQHSQLQLFMDGAPDHHITFVRLTAPEPGPRVPEDLARLAGVPYLAGQTAGALVEAQSIAVPEALGRAGRPHRIIEIDRLDERTIGALMMHMMLETILAADLMGVDPFGQPAVELAKDLTRQRLAAATGTKA